jgi:hypothetical protein
VWCDGCLEGEVPHFSVYFFMNRKKNWDSLFSAETSGTKCKVLFHIYLRVLIRFYLISLDTNILWTSCILSHFTSSKIGQQRTEGTPAFFENIFNHLHKNKLLYKFQSGFIPGLSTTHQLLEIYHTILTALDFYKCHYVQ